MRLASVQSGIVTNVIEAVQRPSWAAGWVEVASDVGPGWLFDGASFSAPVAVPVMPDLNPAQWSYLLDVSGLRAVLDAALLAMPQATSSERAAWAGLKAVSSGSARYTFQNTIALIGLIDAMGLPDLSLPDQSTVEAAWADAAAFNGAGSVASALS